MLAGGSAGVLLPSLNPGDWARAVGALLSDGPRRAALVAAGRVAAGERTIGRTVARVEAELERARGEAA